MKPSDRNNDKWLDELLGQAIGSGRQEPNFEKWQQEHNEAVEKLTSRTPGQSGFSQNIWKTIMQNRIAKLAMAAAIIIVAAILIFHFMNIPIDGAATAYAEVLGRIRQAKNVTYKNTSITRDGEFVTTKTTDKSGMLRIDAPEQGWFMLFDFANGLHFNVYPNIKKCYITHSVGRERRSEPFIWLDWVQKMHHDSSKYMGKENVDGQILEVFVIDVPYEKTTIWVDPKTDLPVKIIMERFPNPKSEMRMPKYSLNKGDFGGPENESVAGSIGSSRGSGLGISERTTQIMTDFVWDSALDPSLFVFEPGEDWQVTEKQVQESEIQRDSLITALSFWTEMTGGQFPEKINDLMDPNLLNPLLIAKYNTGGDPNVQFEQAQQQAITIIRGLFFAQKKKAKDNWHYAGQGAVFGQADIPVCWWQNDDSESWSVIYADLSVAEVNEPPQVDAD